MTVMLELCSVTSVLEENTKPSSPVWCVWTLTVRVTSNSMRVSLKERDTMWLMPLDHCRRWSARNTRSSLRFTVALPRNVCVWCVWWMNIKSGMFCILTLYQLQNRGQRNRYVKLAIKLILSVVIQHFLYFLCRATDYWCRNTFNLKLYVCVTFSFIILTLVVWNRFESSY